MKPPIEFIRKWNKRLSGLDNPMYELHINGTMVRKYRVTRSPGRRELVAYKDYGEKVSKVKVIKDMFQQNSYFYE